jgi:hypothetical protein
MSPNHASLRDGEEQLGPLVSEHGPNRDRLLAHAVVAGIIAAFFYGLTVALALRPTELHIKVLSILWFGGIAGGFIAAAVYYGRRLWWRVRLHERGLVFVRGAHAEVIPWDDVQELYQETRTAAVYGVPMGPPDLRSRLVTTAGKRYGLDPTFLDLAALTAAVTSGVMASLEARAARALRRGEGVSFGPVTLHADGIAVAGGRRRWWDLLSYPLGRALSKTILTGDRLSWPEVKSIKIEAATQGPQSFFQVVIRKKGKKSPWAVQRIPDLPNYDLFVRLVEQLYQPIESPSASE